MNGGTRSAGFGRWAYRLYYAPINRIRDCVREGGPLQQRRARIGREGMIAAARTLPPPAFGGDPLEVHVLTGTRFWYQSAFCLWTLAHASGRRVAPAIYDDGSLTAEQRESLLRTFPEARLWSADELRRRMVEHLPESRFPTLRARRETYPNLRKLMDVHAVGGGWKLVIDSDVLFFRRPHFLLEWLSAPSAPLYEVDVVTSYGYSTELLQSLGSAPIAPKINVGLCGLRSDAIDWDRLEHWTKVLEEREGTHYFLDQALTALFLAGVPCAVAPAHDYVTLPQPPEATECRAVMHHYVANSKRWYFQRNWRHALHLWQPAAVETQ